MRRFLIALMALGSLVAVGATPASASTEGPKSFSCVTQSGGSVTSPPSLVTRLRVSRHDEFDRFAVRLDGPLGQWSVTPQNSATFLQDPSGLPVTLRGVAGLGVVIHGAQAHTNAGQPTVPTDLQPNFPTILEVRQVGDFEGVVSWGIGLRQPACFRVMPHRSRLTVDVLHPDREGQEDRSSPEGEQAG
jgi:hypothetical protein